MKILISIISKPVAAAILIFVFVLAATFKIASQQINLEKEKDLEEQIHELNNVKDRFRNILYSDITAANCLAIIYKQYGLVKDFDSLAAQIIKNNKYAEVLQITVDGVITKVYPLKGYEKTIGLVAKDSMRVRESKRAFERNGTYFAGPRQLRQGGIGILGKVPIRNHQDNYTISAVATNLKTIQKALDLNKDGRNRFSYWLVKKDDQTDSNRYFLSREQAIDNKKIVLTDIPEGDWLLESAPVPEVAFAKVPWVTFVMGGLLAILSSFLIYRITSQPILLKKVIAEKTHKIADQEKYFRTLIETSTDAVVLLDSEGKVLYQTPSVERILGYTLSEMQQIDGTSLIHPEDREADNRTYLEFTQKPGTQLNTIHRIRHKKGYYIWIEGTYLNLLHDETVHAIVLTYSNVTERKQAEEKIRVSEERYRSMIAISNTGGWEYNSDKDFLLCSPEYFMMLGRKLADYDMSGASNLKETWHDLLHPDDKERASNHFADYLRKGSVGTYENYFRMLHADGSWVWIWSRGRTMRDKEGKLANLTIGTHIDITENKKAEIKIRESEEKFRLAFMTSQDAFYIGTLDEGEIIDVNKGFCDIYGYSRQEAIGKTTAELKLYSNPEDRVKMVTILKANRSLKDFESTHIRKDGTLIIVSVTANLWQINNQYIVMAVIRDITERKRIEKELIESAVRFREVLENSLSASYKRIQQTNTYEYLSPVFEKITGYTSEEMNAMVSEMRAALMHPDDIQMVNNAIGRAISKPRGGANVMEYRFKNKLTGKYHWLRDEFVVIKDPQRQVVSFIGSVSDITETKESELKFRNLVEESTFGVYISQKGKFVYVNPRFAKDLGYAEEELLVMDSINQIVYPEDMPLIHEQDKRREIEGIQNNHGELRYLRKDGTVIWGETYNSSIIYKGEEAVIGSLQDITERKKSVESIKQSEANYRQIFDLSPASMWVVDSETSKFIQVNKACIDTYGYSEEEFRQMTIDSIRPPGEQNSNTGFTDTFLRNSRHVKKTGEIIEVETSSIPLVLNGEKKLLVIAIDVTEKNLYEQKLTMAAIKAQEDERYEIGGELHDNICQLLTSAHIFLGLMKKSLSSEAYIFYDKTQQFINSAATETRNLSHRLAPAFFDNETLEDAFQHLLTTFNAEQKYSIELNFDEEAKFHPVSRDLQMNLYRILQEQLRNILKHAKATSIEVRVTLLNGMLQMRIIDDGIGFNANESKGGIGLANMNRRVQLFSGNFTIDSVAGKGCQVIIDIPL